EKWSDENGEDRAVDTQTTDGDIKTDTLAWMWEHFIVDDYSPKPNYKTLIPKAVESKPRVTVPEPFQMTLREEERRLKPRQASMVVSVEPQKPPQFKAN